MTSSAGLGVDLVDALPYIDFEYDEPGMKEMVSALVEEEKKRYRPTKNYLDHLPPLELHQFETEVMKKEFERMNSRTPMEVLSMKRYELPPPPSLKRTDLQAWTECVDNSFAQLEHQAVRINNLELMLDYGCEAWKSYLDVLVKCVAQTQKQLNDLKKRVQEVNWERKGNQLRVGDELRYLESSWVGLVSKNYEIEMVCNDIEARIHYYKLHKEQEGRNISSSSNQHKQYEIPTQNQNEIFQDQDHQNQSISVPVPGPISFDVEGTSMETGENTITSSSNPVEEGSDESSTSSTSESDDNSAESA